MSDDWALNLSAYSTSGILLLGLAYAFAKACKGSQFLFLILLIVLLFISNTGFIVYIAVYGKRKIVNKEGSFEEKVTWNIVSVTADWFRYACFNVAHWLFAVKYWVVSREMPIAIRGRLLIDQSTSLEEVKRREKLYSILNYTGVAFNLLLTTWYCVTYYCLLMNPIDKGLRY